MELRPARGYWASPPSPGLPRLWRFRCDHHVWGGWFGCAARTWRGDACATSRPDRCSSKRFDRRCWPAPLLLSPGSRRSSLDLDEKKNLIIVYSMNIDLFLKKWCKSCSDCSSFTVDLWIFRGSSGASGGIVVLNGLVRSGREVCENGAGHLNRWHYRFDVMPEWLIGSS